MKKTLLTLLCILCCVGFAFANGQNDAATEKVKVDIFQFKVEIVDQLDELVADFEKEYPNIDVEIDTVGGGQDYNAALRLRMTSGSEPSIFNISGQSQLTDWYDFLAPLNAEPWVAKSFNGTLNGVTRDGNVYGMPYGQEGYGIIYNKKILAAAGYTDKELAEIDSLEEYKALFADIESKKDELGIDTVLSFSIGGSAWWTASIHSFNSAVANQEDPSQFIQDLKDGKTSFKDQAVFKEYLKMLDMFFEYSFDNLSTVEYNDQVTSFATGKAAFLHQGNWTYGMISEIDPELEMAFMPFPLGSGKNICTGVPSYWSVNKKKSEAEIQAAKTFLNYMASSQRGHEFLINDVNFIPAYEVSLTPADPLAKSILDFSAEGNTVGWYWGELPTGYSDAVGCAVLEAIQDYNVNHDADSFYAILEKGLKELL